MTGVAFCSGAGTLFQRRTIMEMDLDIPIVATYGSAEDYFEGADGLRLHALRMGAEAIAFEGRHCRETCATFEVIAHSFMHYPTDELRKDVREVRIFVFAP